MLKQELTDTELALFQMYLKTVVDKMETISKYANIEGDRYDDTVGYSFDFEGEEITLISEDNYCGQTEIEYFSIPFEYLTKENWEIKEIFDEEIREKNKRIIERRKAKLEKQEREQREKDKAEYERLKAIFESEETGN